MISQLSHSKCECYANCPLQFWMKYINADIQEEIPFVDYSEVGTFVHERIPEWFDFYQNIKIDEIDDIETHFSHQMENLYRQKYNQLSSEKNNDIAVTCLNNFVDLMIRRYDYLNNLNMSINFLPVFVEKGLRRNINDVPFYGVLDTVFRDNRVWPIDWKTSANTSISKAQIRQATRYAILLDGQYPEPINEFYIVHLRKKVNLIKSRIKITQKMRQEQFDLISQYWQEAQQLPYPKGDKKGCFFCRYKKTCALYDDNGIIKNIQIDTWY